MRLRLLVRTETVEHGALRIFSFADQYATAVLKKDHRRSPWPV